MHFQINLIEVCVQQIPYDDFLLAIGKYAGGIVTKEVNFMQWNHSITIVPMHEINCSMIPIYKSKKKFKKKEKKNTDFDSFIVWKIIIKF